MCFLMLLFGTIGFMIWGRPGFFIGIFVAIVVNNHWRTVQRQKFTAAHAQDTRVRTLFFQSFFAAAGLMAKADGRISSAEIDVVEKIMAQFQLTAEMRRDAIGIFRTARDDNAKSLRNYVQPLADATGNDVEVGAMFIQALAKIALADANVNAAERQILDEVAAIFVMPVGTVDRLLGVQSRGSATSLVQYYAWLDCTPAMSDSEIKQQYRQKCRQYHPDIIQAKGVPPEFVQLATEKVQQFNEAYEAICKARRMT